MDADDCLMELECQMEDLQKSVDGKNNDRARMSIDDLRRTLEVLEGLLK